MLMRWRGFFYLVLLMVVSHAFADKITRLDADPSSMKAARKAEYRIVVPDGAIVVSNDGRLAYKGKSATILEFPEGFYIENLFYRLYGEELFWCLNLGDGENGTCFAGMIDLDSMANISLGEWMFPLDDAYAEGSRIITISDTDVALFDVPSKNKVWETAYQGDWLYEILEEEIRDDAVILYLQKAPDYVEVLTFSLKDGSLARERMSDDH